MTSSPMPLPELRRRLRDQTLHRRLSKRKISLKNLANAKNATHRLARRIKNTKARFTKKHIQISIDKLRDRKQIVPELVHKSDIIRGEEVIYLDYAGTKHLTLLVILKSPFSLCDRRVRLENHLLFPVMCCEQSESMSHVFSRPPSITYIGREEVDGSVLG
jgi:hypothetical protein